MWKRIWAAGAVLVLALVGAGWLMAEDETYQEVRIRIAPDYCGLFTVYAVDASAGAIWDSLPDDADPVDARDQIGVVVKDDREPGHIRFGFVSGTDTDLQPRVFRDVRRGTFQINRRVETAADGSETIIDSSGQRIGYLQFEIQGQGQGDCTPLELANDPPAKLFETLLK